MADQSHSGAWHANPAREHSHTRPISVFSAMTGPLTRASGIGFGAFLLVTLAAGSPAWAAEGSSSLDVAFLKEVMVLVLVGRILAEAMQRLGQPAVMGPLIGGLLLGPSVLGALWPSAQHALLASDPE
jgi:predicted lipid-binding transport protein (Tim44 family)